MADLAQPKPQKIGLTQPGSKWLQWNNHESHVKKKNILQNKPQSKENVSSQLNINDILKVIFFSCSLMLVMDPQPIILVNYEIHFYL